jgi:hypothetical protein
MLIRREQFSALAGPVGTEFAARLALLLQQHFEEARQVPSRQLQDDIARTVRRAQVYGLATERDAAAFVITAFLLGENFDDDFPAAQQVLTSPVLGGADKAEWLEEWTTKLFQTLTPAGK